MTWNKNMDDAPRDGTPILVAGKSVFDENEMYVCEAIGYSCGFSTEQGTLRNQPIAWMPLPQPPEVEG